MHLLDPIFLLAKQAFLILIGLFGIGFLIGFHELGHFLFCKLFKIRTPSFSIGMGPKIFSKKIGETEFSLSAFPLGGYVEIAGAAEVGQGEQKDAHSRDKYSFAVKPYWQKLFVMLGGILFNLMFAYFAFCLVFAFGAPKTPLLYPILAQPIIESVSPDSAASQAGIEVGDKIVAIDNENINGNITKILKTIRPIPGKDILVTVQRNGETKNVPVTLGSKQIEQTSVGTLGVTFVIDAPKTSFFQNIKRGIKATNTYIWLTIKGFLSLFQTRDFSGMAGPIRIISMTMKGAAAGIKILLLFLAIISINLAILNLVPLPILDGGQILFYTIEALAGKPLPAKVREYIHIASWIGVLLLIIVLSFKDIFSIGHPYFLTLRRWLGF